MEVKVKTAALWHCISSYKVSASDCSSEISFSNMLVTISGTVQYPGADHHNLNLCLWSLFMHNSQD